MEQRKYNYRETVELQLQEHIRLCEKEMSELPAYHTPQVFIIDKVIHLMKNEATGSFADSGGAYVYGT